MAKSETEKAVGMMLRLPPDLHRRLVDRAGANKRSMNSEAVALLDRALSATDALGVEMLQDEVRRIQAEIDATARHLNLLSDRRNRLKHAIGMSRGSIVEIEDGAFLVENGK